MKEIEDVVITQIRRGEAFALNDLLAVEEPLEMRLVYRDSTGEVLRRSVAVTMRTPGKDSALVRGFFISEKIIGAEDIVRIEEGENIVTVFTKDRAQVEVSKLSRNFFMTSSCGVCGKATLEDLKIGGFKKIVHTKKINIGIVLAIPPRSLERQKVFQKTGGLHAASAYTYDGQFIAIAEDVGRHNAFDKLIGALLEQGQNCSDCIVFLSGRVSFELVQKAVSLGVPFLASVGAPSSLAVQTAKAFNLGLIAFIRKERANIYSGFEYMDLSS